MKLLYYILFFFIVSCGFKGNPNSYNEKIIELYNYELSSIGSYIEIHDDNVRIVIPVEAKNSYAFKRNNVVDINDNMNLKSDYDEKLFNLVWNRLEDGTIILFDRNGVRLNTVTKSIVRDFGGVQEYYYYSEKIVFIRKVISMGE